MKSTKFPKDTKRMKLLTLSMKIAIPKQSLFTF